MKAKKPNEIREEVRKQMAAKYKQDLDALKQSYIAAKNELGVVKEENLKLKEQIEAQKDWIERLMEFIDMPEEERHGAVKKYLHDRKITEDFNAMFGPYFKVLHRLSLL